jgi:hypothetical protein
MAAMTCERFRFEKMSAIDSCERFAEIISILNVVLQGKRHNRPAVAASEDFGPSRCRFPIHYSCGGG